MLSVKQPGERKAFDYDFRAPLGAASISAILSAVSAPRGAGANMAKMGEGFQAGVVRILWEGGADGEDYATTVRISDSLGAQYELDGEIQVRERLFVVPAVAIADSPYLSAAEYVARFGQEETVRITDEARAGVIDKPRLSAALRDASEFAEAFLASRYSIPLSSAPPILKGIIADLAREALFGQRPLPAVTAAADRARQALRDFSSGRMVLAIETGAEAELQPFKGRAAWGPGSAPIIFAPEILDRY